MGTFLELPRRSVDESDWTLALQAVRYGCRDLGLRAEPAVRWFRDGSPAGKSAWSGYTFEQDTDPGKVLAGMYDPAPSTLWLRDGMKRRGLLRTAFHELHHMAYGTHATPDNEAAAERWGRDMADEFISRPSAVKSLFEFVVPTTLLTETGAVLTVNRTPGVDERTDLGDAMYGVGRPLVASGFGGYGSDRIGTVKGLHVDDGELWARGEFERADRYLAYLQRLVEQGSLEASPILLDKLAARDARGRLSSMPVVGVELRPLAA